MGQHLSTTAQDGESCVAIGWAKDAMLHACLGVAHAPVAQGADAAASALAIRKWFFGLVTSINPRAPVKLEDGTRSTECFHHFTQPESAAVMDALRTPEMCDWNAALASAGLSPGKLYVLAGGEDGGIAARQVPVQPFS